MHMRIGFLIMHNAAKDMATAKTLYSHNFNVSILLCNYDIMKT